MRRIDTLTPVTPPRESDSEAHGPVRVLIVDREPQIRRLLSDCLSEPGVVVLQAGSVREARAHFADGPIALAVIDSMLPDGSGLMLAEEIREISRHTQSILLTGQNSVSAAIDAIRAGASDLIQKPLNLGEATDRIRQAIGRHKEASEHLRQVIRLRKVCKRLAHAYHKISRKADMLAIDLASTKQQLQSAPGSDPLSGAGGGTGNNVQTTTPVADFAAMIQSELELQSMLRKTLEFILKQAGPTNAAIFLPGNVEGYSLGGYINYDCSRDSADMLLQHLADVLAPAFASRTSPVQITDNEAMEQWLGDDSAYLADSHMIVFTARHRDETLAVITLFRDGEEPFKESLVESCTQIAPVLGTQLARIIRVHHRGMPELFEEA